MDQFIMWYRDSFLVFLGVMLVVAAASFLLSRLLGLLAQGVLDRISHRTMDNATADAICHALEPMWKHFLPLIFLGIAMHTAHPDSWWHALASRVASSLLMVGIGVFLYRIVDAVPTMITHKPAHKVPKSLAKLILNVLHVMIVAVLLVTIPTYWGINLTPIVAGAGLFGIALALGAQDLFKNFISGLLVILERRFDSGDFVSIPGRLQGVVKSVGLRSSIISNLDRTVSYVPNSLLSDEAVVNVSERDSREIRWVLTVEYGTTSEQIQGVISDIRAYIEGNNDFNQKADTHVCFEAFNDSSIGILLWTFSARQVPKEYFAVRENLALEVMRIMENREVNFAFPSLSVYMEKAAAQTPSLSSFSGKPPLATAN